MHVELAEGGQFHDFFLLFLGEIPDNESKTDDSTEDEGIVSDESPPSSSSNDEILINHQDLKNLAVSEKDVLVSDKRRTNIGQRTKNHKEKTKTKREKVGKKRKNPTLGSQNLYEIPNSYSKLSSTTHFEFTYVPCIYFLGFHFEED